MRPANDAVTVAILCLVACVRVFVYSAAFPFFNNVDEQAHLDLVCKYSHGQVPRQLEGFGRESADAPGAAARTGYGRACEDSARVCAPTLSESTVLHACCSFARASSWICRTRSALRSSSSPTSCSVRAGPSKP